MHQASLHSDNSFVTLTYDEDNLPDHGTLKKSHVQDFIKSLRQRIKPQKISYFLCGEYGDTTERPHYHIALFGYQFPDLALYSSRDNIRCYTSELCDSVWKKGRSIIGTLTYQSAAYIARYTLKKLNGETADGFYQRLDLTTGEIIPVEHEFMLCSTRPGIGKDWFKQYSDETFPCDFVVVDGKKHPVPVYYTRLAKNLEAGNHYPGRTSTPKHKSVKNGRFKKALKNAANNTPPRLAVREEVKRATLSNLKRNL